MGLSAVVISGAAWRQDLADFATVFARIAGLDPDAPAAGKVADQAFSGEKRGNPPARAFTDAVRKRRIPRDEVTGIDHEIAVADELLNASKRANQKLPRAG